MLSKFKNISLVAFLAVVILFSAGEAYADQAAWVTKAEAQRALKVLADAESVIHYCAPCSDDEVKRETIRTIGIAPAEDGKYWEVQINGKGVDLAYIYFPKKGGKWSNAAIAAKIKVSDVPKQLSKELFARAS